MWQPDAIELVLTPMTPSCPDATAAGYYPPNLSAISAGTGNVIYHRAGLGVPTVPTPGYLGGWHFPLYNVADALSHTGFKDQMGINVGDNARCIVVGDGTITIYTLLQAGGSARTCQATLYHLAGAIETLDAVQTGLTVGDPVTFEVDTADRTICTHWVDLEDVDIEGASSGVGFDGFDWVPA